MNPIRSILHWPSAAGHLLSRVASPAIFGADPSLAPMAGEPNPLGQALSTAGTTLALSQGGPRRWGEFAASPLASITAGLAAGQQVYRDAQSNTRRRRAYDAVPLPAEGPTLPYLSQLFRTAVMQGDEPTAREIAGMASSHAFINGGQSVDEQLRQARIDLLKAQAEHFRTPAADKTAVLPNGDLVNTKTGRVIASGPRPITPKAPAADRPVSLAERESRAAIINARRSAREMLTLFNAEGSNATIGMLPALARGVGQRLHMPEAGDAAAQALGMQSGQIEFQRAADNLLHNLSSVLPKGGRSIALLQSLRNSFTPRAGQFDQASARRFVEEANRVIDTIATQVGVPDEEGGGANQGADLQSNANAVVERYRARLRGAQ